MTTFPDFVFVNDATIRYQVSDNVMRSEMESGVAKTRQINSAPTENITFDISVNRMDLGKFYKWFSEDTKSGQLWFLMRHPLAGTVKRFRFVTTDIAWEKIGTLLVASVTIEGYHDV